MTITYDDITSAFLEKISEYEFLQLSDRNRESIVDGYIKRSAAKFRKVCEYDLTKDDTQRQFTDDFKDEDVDDIVDIITDGMVVQWLKPYVNQQDILQNVLNTNDYSQYSPAELLHRVGEAYDRAVKEYKRALFNYSYDHGDLTDLHL